MKLLFDNMVDERGAEFSDCGKYRYKLWRIWDPSKPIVMCIGLNPSTANKIQNDHTITKLERHLIPKNGYGGFYMMNLFAFITPEPKILKTCHDPVGQNNKHLTEVSAICKAVIFCWGAFNVLSMYDKFKDRVEFMEEMFPEALCFGFTKNYDPRHPLMLAGDTGIIKYNTKNDLLHGKTNN